MESHLAREPEHLGHVGRFHESEIAHHAEKAQAQVLYLYALFIRNLRGLGRHEGEDDHPFVKDLVELEEVQKGAGHPSAVKPS